MLPRFVAFPTALALAAVLLAAAPAQADLVGSTSSSNVVLKNKCVKHPIAYSFLVSPGTLLWKTKISVVSPTGATSEGVDLSSVAASPTSGTVTFLVCGSYTPGTYTVKTTGAYQIVPAVNIPISVADSTFQVRRAATRTTLASSHLQGKSYRLVATVKDQHKAGFQPTESAEVKFQRKVNGAWKLIKGSRTFSDHGLATTVVRAAPGTKVRAVTAHAGYLGGSTSKPVRV